MTNALVIAAVTATLRGLILHAPSLPSGTFITALSPEEAHNSTHGNQVNLFLYHVLPNAAWRNRGMPGRVKPGETSTPPLALNLYYILTAYHRENADLVEIASQGLLGRAMSMLYDYPVLGPGEIQEAIQQVLTQNNPYLQQALTNNDLYLQPERIRITLQPLSLEEMSKLWMMFHTRYRTSAAYEVSVVLIESTLPAKTPLPVLTRGKNDSGIVSRPDLVPPMPTLLALKLPQQPGGLPGDDLILSGHDLRPLDIPNVMVRFTNPNGQTVEISPGTEPTPTEVTVSLPLSTPDAPVQWPAGFYAVAVVFKDAQDQVVRATNNLSFSLAPKILLDPPMQAVRDPESLSVTITLSCSPAVGAEQRAILLLGDLELPALPVDPLSPPRDQLTFQARDIASGVYLVRLRVDGVDSLLVMRKDGEVPTFDLKQRVVLP